MHGVFMKKYRELQVDIGGKKYTIASDDDYLDYIRKGFEPEMVKLFRVLATDSETILDVGANIGCTTLLFGELAKNVYAFEPSPSTFLFLERNIASSGRKNIFPQNIGLGDVSSEFSLTFAPSNRSGGYVSNHTTASTGHIVEEIVVRQLDEVTRSMDFKTIDFIKIDVEGYEGHVLRGAREVLSNNKPVVVLELNHWCLNAFQRTSIPDFFDLLRSMFPILLAVDGEGYMDLHSKNDSYVVMYLHILQMRFPNIVCGFDEIQVAQFKSLYKHGYIA